MHMYYQNVLVNVPVKLLLVLGVPVLFISVIIGWGVHNNVSFTCLINGVWENSPMMQRALTDAERGNIDDNKVLQFLGHHYINHYCVPSTTDNLIKGAKFLEQAAKSGDGNALVKLYARAELHEELTPYLPRLTILIEQLAHSPATDRATKKTLINFINEIKCNRATGAELSACREQMRKGAESGNVRTMEYYARMLFDGRGGVRDKEAAWQWINRAISKAKHRTSPFNPELDMLLLRKNKMSVNDEKEKTNHA